MTVNISRSLNSELNEGSTDGKYRKVRPHTTIDDPSMGDDLVRANRAGLHPYFNYGFIDSEKVDKVAPTALHAHSVAPAVHVDHIYDQTQQENQ